MNGQGVMLGCIHIMGCLVHQYLHYRDIGLLTYYMKRPYQAIDNQEVFFVASCIASCWLRSCRCCCTMDILSHAKTDTNHSLQLQCHLTSNIRRISTILSLSSQKSEVAGTALMLLILVWQPHLHILSVSTLLRITMLAESIGAGCCMSVYIGCIHQYNSLTSQPDILKPLFSALQQSSSLGELRYHDGGRLLDQQMALLQYQRENLRYLSEEVLRLQELLSQYQRADDGTAPQVDLAHLLAARDQELRALAAEIDQAHSELRLARSLLVERDDEIQRIRSTNNKYVQEDERLRAILGEWSSRVAKLERALGAERALTMELQKSILKLRNHSSPSPKLG